MDDLLRVLKATFGHAGFRPGQEEIVRAVAEGEDVLVVMPTGAGKSLCYQLPALARSGTTLVVSPLIALMKDQVDALHQKGVAATFINSSLSPAERQERTEGLLRGAYQLVYVAPERFNPRFVAMLQRARIGLLAIDEAHCVSEWGHDFRPDYLRLGPVREALGRPPTVALTATATPEVQRDIVRLVGIEGCRCFVRGFDRKNIALEVVEVGSAEQKLGMLPGLVAGGPALVYCATRRNVERVVRALRDAEVPAGMYHGGMEHPDRVRVQEAFMQGRVPVVVATNAFGMGVDKSDLRTIVHVDIPGSIEAYYQEIGRAGRDGRPSRAVLLFQPSDRRIQEFFIRSSHPEAELVEQVYRELWSAWRAGGAGEPLVEAGREQLAAALPEGSGGEAVVSACLRVLERQGWVRRVAPRDRPGCVRLQQQPASPPRGLAGRVYEAVARRLAHEPEEGWVLEPERLCRELTVEREQLLAALRGLEGRGLLTYEAPRQVGAIELLRPDEPLRIDREALHTRRQAELQKLERMVGYVHAACRRHHLLTYFGERPPFERCGTCDACRRGDVGATATAGLSSADQQIARGVLACVHRLRGEYTPTMVARVLTGSTDRAVRALRLDRAMAYGLLSSWSMAEVDALVEALVHAGALDRRFVTHPVQGRERTYAVVALTDLGERIVAGEPVPEAAQGLLGRALPRRGRSPSRPVAAPAPRPAAPQAPAQDLLSYLQEVRRQVARAADVPAYVVASNRTLEELAARRPGSRQAMLAVHGMGPKRFQLYGQPLLDALQAWGGT
ncbi:MAG: ATP-dependent DNA helicase RecQ [Pseudomonadota bacterium]